VLSIKFYVFYEALAIKHEKIISCNEKINDCSFHDTHKDCSYSYNVIVGSESMYCHLDNAKKGIQ